MHLCTYVVMYNHLCICQFQNKFLIQWIISHNLQGCYRNVILLISYIYEACVQQNKKHATSGQETVQAPCEWLQISYSTYCV